jgi:proteasome assembly chaperone (PAC2) family protein
MGIGERDEMQKTFDLWKKPETQEIYMLAGWRQWADAGSVSSGLPEYLIEWMHAERIGAIRPDGFYIFQFPGTHDLVRPVVRFEEGYPVALETPHNDVYYFGNDQRGLVVFLGDEPHMDIERYVKAILAIAQQLNVKRIIGLGGVFGELPYDKERTISANYSLTRLKNEVSQLAVGLSDYQGGASIGSYVCRRAGDTDMEYIGLYALVPSYDFTPIAHIGSAIRLEYDYMAWLGVMRRINYLTKLNLDLSDLEKKSKLLVKTMNAKVDEIEREAPQLGLRKRLQEISAEYKETPFIPLDDVWEEELRRLMDKFDPDSPSDER